MQRSSDVKQSAGGTIDEVCSLCKYQASRLVERRGGGVRENSKGGTTREDTIGGGGTGGSCALSRPARGYDERLKLPQKLSKIAFQNHHLFYHHHFLILCLFAVGCQRNS